MTVQIMSFTEMAQCHALAISYRENCSFPLAGNPSFTTGRSTSPHGKKSDSDGLRRGLGPGDPLGTLARGRAAECRPAGLG